MHKGVDLSHHQTDNGPVDFNKIKGAGYDFAILKITEGQTFVDPAFKNLYPKAKSTMKLVGGYHFFRATDVATALREEKFFVKTIKDHDLELDFLALDAEHPVNGDMTKAVLAFLDELSKDMSLPVILYSYPYWIESHLTKDATKYPLWISHFKTSEPKLVFWKEYAIWQHSSTEHVPGIVGYADVNVMTDGFFKYVSGKLKKYSSPAKAPTKPTDTTTYTIKEGDNFWNLEEKNHWAHGILQKLNPKVDPNRLKVGQKIKVPGKAKVKASKVKTYVIKKGDTFWELEEKHGWKHGTLQKLNPKVDPNSLKVGQKIIIP